MKFNADVKILKAMLNLAGDKDIRSYLNGIQCELNGTHIQYIATDGAKLGVFRQLNEAGACSILIPRDVIKACKFTGKGAAIALIDTDARTLQYSDATYALPDLGKYPDYRRVLPEKVSGEHATYDPELLIHFKAAFIELNRAGYKISAHIPQLGMNGESGALVRIGNAAVKKADMAYSEDFVGVVMPMRMFGDDVASCPAWVRA